MLFTPFLSSLRTAYKTSVRLSDTTKERDYTTTPLASICRFDCTLDEAGSEASMQSALQWSYYLAVQLIVGNSSAPDSEEFRFKSLVISGVLSTISLTLGQFKRPQYPLNS